MVLPDDVAPVEPDVPELLVLEVSEEPLDESEAPLEEGWLLSELLDESMPELLELLELSPAEEELVEGDTDPVAEPDADPMPELEPVIDPDDCGGLLVHAANKSAQAMGDNHLNIGPP